nr:hypothetical protein [Tanacetum cinerariifolium]
MPDPDNACSTCGFVSNSLTFVILFCLSRFATTWVGGSVWDDVVPQFTPSELTTLAGFNRVMVMVMIEMNVGRCGVMVAAGANNDINVLDNSSLLDDLLDFRLCSAEMGATLVFLSKRSRVRAWLCQVLQFLPLPRRMPRAPTQVAANDWYKVAEVAGQLANRRVPRCMITRYTSTDLVPPLSDPKSVIQNRLRNLGDPSLLLDFEEINMNPNNVQGPPPMGPNPQNHVVPRVLASQFELKIGLLNLVTAISFHGFENDDPHSHIRRTYMMLRRTTMWEERPQGAFPSNTMPNPQEEIKEITTRSGIVLAGPSVLLPPLSSSSSKEVKRDPKMITDQVLPESTTRVPPLVVQSFPYSRSLKIPPSPTLRSSMIPKRNPHQPPIPYPLRLNKEKLQDKSDI